MLALHSLFILYTTQHHHHHLLPARYLSNFSQSFVSDRRRKQKQPTAYLASPPSSVSSPLQSVKPRRESRAENESAARSILSIIAGSLFTAGFAVRPSLPPFHLIPFHSCDADDDVGDEEEEDECRRMDARSDDGPVSRSRTCHAPARGRGRSHQAGHPIPIRVYSPDSAAEHQVRYCGNEQEGAMRKA